MSRSSRTAVFGVFFVVSSLLAMAAPPPGTYTVIGWNDLGMHCMDADYALFSLLPPYNVIHAQLIDATGHRVTNLNGITVTYEPVADPSGSINTTSAGKTNFWDHVGELFGANLPADQGLKGYPMPGAMGAAKPMAWDPDKGWFSAEGIPITPYDDAHRTNYYPMLRLTARDAQGRYLGATDIVLPVSDEMTCKACHASGSSLDARPAQGWAWDADPERDYRMNVLLLHDTLNTGNPDYAAALATMHYSPQGLYATAVSQRTAVLCAGCHGSNALGTGSQPGVKPLTAAMHSRHSFIDTSAGRSNCYSCHPGSSTRCLRGAMGNAVAADGSMAMQCQNCHGSMAQVGDTLRTGWLQEPSCQQCHTGTATHNNGQIRYTSVFEPGGQERQAVDLTFATDPNAPMLPFNLYRFSFGHGGLACEACHGPTHAEGPSREVNDNQQAINIQGHAGTLVECSSCHKSSPSTTTGGPHGMHPVGQTWVDRHPDIVENGGAAQCQLCHGSDYRGTVLSRSQADRSLSAWGTKNFWKGFRVGCYNCHRGPDGGDSNPNRAPVASNNSVTTPQSTPVNITLGVSDADGNPVGVRIVAQPQHGTTGLAAKVATYYPDAGFVGTDSFTFAGWDGSTNSNLATVTITVTATNCTLSCSAVAPGTAPAGAAVPFGGSATASAGCGAVPAYSWSFGDGSSPSTLSSPTHAYGAGDSYLWVMTTTVADQVCTRKGQLRVTTATPQRVPEAVRAAQIVSADHGQSATVTWDASNCPSPGYHLLYGYGSTLTTQGTAGAACGLGTAGTFAWSSLPDPSGDASRLLWFLVAADDTASTEGSWGRTSAGAERGGDAASGLCSVTARVDGGCTP